MRVALAQLNPTVGDLSGNTQKMISWIDQAREQGCELIVFPELSITGYPPEDLLLKSSFIEANLRSVEEIIKASQGIAVIGGFVDREGQLLYNAAFLASNGQLLGKYHKFHLPNYGVFDEKRYFSSGKDPAQTFQLNEMRIGISICEDAWYPESPIAAQGNAGAQLLININGSPFHAGKRAEREEMILNWARETALPLIWVNLVGGQDELVFDGNSLIANSQGKVVAHAHSLEEELLIVNLEGENSITPPLEGTAEIYSALRLGIRDYFHKVGIFPKIVLGLSGGIDSSLAATLAVDAIGADSVVGVLMPSRYTSSESREDAFQLAAALNIETHEIPINGVAEAFSQALTPSFQGTEPGIAEENLQARIRGAMLMALNNRFGWLVLNAGNKSELATGYCTIYGDMVGGFNALKDISKTTAYELARYRNEIAQMSIIPQRVLVKPPTAELRENQCDQDTLPPYNELDQILQGYVEMDLDSEELVAAGHPEQMVQEVIQLVNQSEWKRRQAAPGVKITPRAFGRDRRMPIVNRYLR